MPTREEVLQELENRGIDTGRYTPVSSPQKSMQEINKQTAYNALKQRGYEDDKIIELMNNAHPEKAQDKPFWESFIKEVPEYGGALLGGILGASAGPLGAIGGAALGGAAGKAYQQIGQHITGDEEAPQTSMDAVKDIAMAGGRQAAYEAGGRFVVGAAGKVLSPFRKGITPEAKIAQDTLDKYMPKETSLLRPFSRLTGQKVPTILPAEATENRVLDILNNIAESSLIGGKSIAEYKNIIRPQAVNEMVDDLIGMFGQKAEPDLVGEAFTLAVEGNLKPSRMLSTVLYNNVADMTKDVMVSTSALKKFAEPLAQVAKEVQGIEAKNAGDDVIQAIMELGDNVSFTVAKDLRSRLLSKIDEFSIINKKAPAIGKAKKGVGIIDHAIEEALQASNPQALSLWRQANKIYREGSEQFDNEFVRRLIKQSVDKGNPEVIAKQIFKPGAISNIKKAKAAVDDPTWKQLQSWYVQDLLKKSVNTTGEIQGNTLYNNLFGKTGMGEKALNEILKPDELVALKNVAITLKTIQSKQAEGTGKMFIQLSQAAATVGILTGTATPASTVILGGPVVLARVLTNPLATKWLIQGAKLPKNSPQIATVIAKFGAMAAKVKQNMEETKQYTMKDIQKLKGKSTLN